MLFITVIKRMLMAFGYTICYHITFFAILTYIWFKKIRQIDSADCTDH